MCIFPLYGNQRPENYIIVDIVECYSNNIFHWNNIVSVDQMNVHAMLIRLTE